jgi:hypothetical protein
VASYRQGKVRPGHMDGGDPDAAVARGARRDGCHAQRNRTLAPTSTKGVKEEGDDGDVSGSSLRDLAGSDSARWR